MSTTTARHQQTDPQAGATEGTEPPARPWTLVAGREIRVKLTDRNFLLSTLFTVGLIAAIFGIQAFFFNLSSAPEYRVAVTDPDAVAVVEQAGASMGADPFGGSTEEATVTAVQVEDEAAGRELVAAEEADVVLTREGGTWTVGADGDPPASLAGALQEAVRGQVMTDNAAAAGTTLGELMAGTEVAFVDYASADDSEGELVVFVAGLLFGMLFYVASLLFGLSIAQSVVEEKQSRIVEILTAAIPVRQLLAGKVLGNTALALGQMVLLVAVGLVGLSFTAYDAFLPMLAEPLLWYLPFFVAGFIALACIWAAAGAMASRSEDLQTTTMPLTLGLVVVYIVAQGLDGTWSVVGSYVPVMSTFLMPIRLLEGEALWWEPVLSLAVTLAFCWMTVRFGARLYRRALLQTQGRITFRQALSLGE
ncbi:ABC transporter permease [Ornithinimicrobium sediminis]|uniref:ABC transporter permease n=1 Tax=Ornithinimicrobium sediminis TaxID=2904603 RepID=UPI001E3425FF|nr:ABC transporter permease [Ornithinimicrobium sediminis]